MSCFRLVRVVVTVVIVGCCGEGGGKAPTTATGGAGVFRCCKQRTKQQKSWEGVHSLTGATAIVVSASWPGGGNGVFTKVS